MSDRSEVEDFAPQICALIIAPGRGAQCFGAKISSATLELWKTKLDQVQVIGQAELFPLLISRLTWNDWIAGERVLYFIDNESSRLCMIKGYSPVLPSLQIVMQCLSWDYKHDSSGWYARVPSLSNPGDDPSRLVVPSLGFPVDVVSPVFPPGHWPDDILRVG